MKLKYLVTQGLILFCLSTTSSADISWKQVDISSTLSSKETIRQTIYFSTDKFAIKTDDGMWMILNLSIETVTTIDTNEKTYMVAKLDELRQIHENIEEETKKILDNELKNMPENQREAYKILIEEQMKKRMEREGENAVPLLYWEAYKPTGKTENILGYTTLQYIAAGEDSSEYELWSTKEVDISELNDFFTNISELRFFRDIRPTYNTMKLGFPLKFKKKLKDKQYNSEVVSISFETIPASLFTVPEGFTKIPSSVKSGEKQ